MTCDMPAQCLFLFCKLLIQNKEHKPLPSTHYRAFCEWLGAYQYVYPADRVINKDLINYLLQSNIPFRTISIFAYTIEHYTNGQQTEAFELLLATNLAQLSEEVSAIQAWGSSD